MLDLIPIQGKEMLVTVVLCRVQMMVMVMYEEMTLFMSHLKEEGV